MTVITLITDFGLKDSYVAEMKGVILGINPDATVVDISHDVENYEIESGAFQLARSVPYFPEGTIHVGVVDPGVGGSRKQLIIKSNEALFVGPDNGLLAPAAERRGVESVYEITRMELLPERVSQVFDGRDVFSPTAAHISRGMDPQELGEKIEEYKSLPSYHTEISGDTIETEIIHVDGFGNLVTNVTYEILNEAGVKVDDKFRVKVGSMEMKLPYVKNFSAVPKGELLTLVAGGGYLEIAANQGNAQKHLKIERGQKITLEPI